MDRAEIGTVIVTGAASGLGRAIAEAVAEAGGTPVSLDLKAADGIAGEVVDLADHQAAEAATRKAIEDRGGVDAVVTAAGTDSCGPLERIPAEEWNRVVQVNLLGSAAVIRAALPALERSRGKVVTVASTLGLRGLPDATAYCASKFGVVGFTRALATEMGNRVGVTMLVPGGMRTHFFDDRPESFKPAPDQQLNDPADVARSVIFALRQPVGCELRELIVAPATEPSWP